MTDELFSLRPAREGDMALVNAYARGEGMPDIPGTDGVTVAVNADDAPVGFIRIVFDDAGVAHVNPVVTYEAWRGFGVGRALVEDALGKYGELRLVSRGSSLAFYRALGFEDVAWDAIKPDIAAECDGCELVDECRPQPVGKVVAAPAKPQE